MSDASEIEWTDATWNPTRGCTKVSPGCKHCYAETFAERWRGIPGHPYEQGFDPRLVREALDIPRRWRKARRIFVNSMSDLFMAKVPDGFILDVFRTIVDTPQHTYQILTKRPERMVEWFGKWADNDPPGEPIMARGPEAVRAAHTSGRARLFADMIEGWGPAPAGAAYPFFDWAEGMRWWQTPFWNTWLGVSVEDRRRGVPRIDLLRRVPARLRFLSIEPLLEDVGELDLTGIGWVIVGGESGRMARDCNTAWIRSVVRQADAAKVPVFVKQLGAAPVGLGAPLQLRRSKGSDMAQWPADLAGRRAMPVTWKAAA